MIKNQDRKAWVKLSVTPEIETAVLEAIKKEHPVISMKESNPHHFAFFSHSTLVEGGVCEKCMLFRVAFNGPTWDCEEVLNEVFRAFSEDPSAIVMTFEECKCGIYKGFKVEFYNTEA